MGVKKVQSTEYTWQNKSQVRNYTDEYYRNNEREIMISTVSHEIQSYRKSWIGKISHDVIPISNFITKGLQVPFVVTTEIGCY